MPNLPLLDLIGPAALLPALLTARRAERRDVWFWGGLLIAFAGTAFAALLHQQSGWDSGLGAALQSSIAVSLLLFIPLALRLPAAGRLAPLLVPYLLALAISASLAALAPRRIVALDPSAWVALHVGLSLATYALLSLAAVASLATWLRERALRRKQAPSQLVAALPAMAEGTWLLHELLRASLFVLGIGLATGIGANWHETHQLLHFDHKTLLSFVTFIVVGGLLFSHRRGGIGGRRLAHGVLAAWLLLSLAFPGVKFVTGFLLG